MRTAVGRYIRRPRRLARFPGTSGDYASTDDNAAFSALTDFSVLFLGSLDDWTPGTLQAIISQYGGAGDRSWRFTVLGTASSYVLRLLMSSDGTATFFADSTVAPTVTDATVYWILFTRESASGEVKFYQAAHTAGMLTPPPIGSFTQIGTTVTTSTGALFNSTAVLEVGSSVVGTASLLDGDTYRAMLYTGIYGSGSETLVRDFVPLDAANTAATSWVSQRTGETWTLNGGDVLLVQT